MFISMSTTFILVAELKISWHSHEAMTTLLRSEDFLDSVAQSPCTSPLRDRAYFFWMRKRLEKRENDTLVCLMSRLTKEAWDFCEAITTKKFDQSTELTKHFAILDQHVQVR